MIRKGECLACVKISQCRDTNVEKVLQSYTCVLFEPAAEDVFRARWDAMQQYGEQSAVRAMLPLHHTEDEEMEDA